MDRSSDAVLHLSIGWAGNEWCLVISLFLEQEKRSKIPRTDFASVLEILRKFQMEDTVVKSAPMCWDSRWR